MICVKEYELPPLDLSCAAAYAGMGRRASEEEISLLEVAGRELARLLVPRVCYTELPVLHTSGGVAIGGVPFCSDSLAMRLCDCDSAVLFVATVGGAPDRLMAKYSHVSPAASLAVSAVGSERVEALCDLFCAELVAENATRGRVTVQRFSPGYGDLPLSVQRDIFLVLAPHKHIGVMLGEGLLMSPSKSVSAIVGIKPRKDSL